MRSSFTKKKYYIPQVEGSFYFPCHPGGHGGSKQVTIAIAAKIMRVFSCISSFLFLYL